jgi:hypothetical protein
MSAATFLNLSGFASLREIAVIKGREEFFTLRREGAKNTCGSKHRISFRDLSGSASLRDTAVIEAREEVFTRRRQGAKETYGLKDRSCSQLSADSGQRSEVRRETMKPAINYQPSPINCRRAASKPAEEER